MKVAGVVAEYNPFHTGHRYQLRETRRAVGEDGAIVCVMSGHWVQRGECALTDKWTRAAMALRGGVDLVLELPTPWAAASAETFARGAVGLLAATGVVDGLSFGSEDGDADRLWQAARCLDSDGYSARLRRFLDEGMSFAAARAAAVRDVLGPGADCLSTPNNNLAVEYLRAMPADWTALAVRRVGAGHDGAALGEYASASALRGLLRGGDADRAAGYLPTPWTGETADMVRIERAVLARLRGMEPEALERCPDGGEGLARRVLAAAGRAECLEALYHGAKTKRYAHARIRRLVLWAFLGLEETDRGEGPPYLRVLGFGARGQGLLREMKDRARLPVLTKPAHAKALDGAGRRLFEREARCTDLYGLCFERIRPGGLEWTTGAVRDEG